MDGDADNTRGHIRNRLAGGLGTEAFPRADTHEEVQQVVRRLQESDKSLDAKLVIGGFTLWPVTHYDVEQACESCMYYLRTRRHCELPELDLPVEPEWSCRLWRI